jgi:hypothetical protein
MINRFPNLWGLKIDQLLNWGVTSPSHNLQSGETGSFSGLSYSLDELQVNTVTYFESEVSYEEEKDQIKKK